jgi:translation initiation factor 2B subunit (eIF-2B alpha/beta/delta family)
MSRGPAEELLERVRGTVGDTRRGSSQIALSLLELLAETPQLFTPESSQLLMEIYSAVRARRALVSPITLVSIILNALRLAEERGVALTVGEAASRLLRIYREALDRASSNLAAALSGCGAVLTLSKSSQVLRALKEAKTIRARILAGWPLMDGLEAFRELEKAGLSPRLYPDLSIGEALRGVDAVLVGCDAVLGDGAAANRSGSYVVALAAKARDVPTIVVCDSSKLDVEGCWEREAWSVSWEGLEFGFDVFERIEPRLISEYVCEWGRAEPTRFVEAARRVVTEDWPARIVGARRLRT